MNTSPDLWAQPFSAKAGDALFAPGLPCPGLIELEEGSIKVSLTGGSGRELVLYRVLPGQLCLQTFACLTGDVPYSADGTAETDLRGSLVPSTLFRRRLDEDPAFRDRILTAVSHRFGQYERLVEDTVLTGFDVRLARALLRLADDQDELHMTHDALASEVASGRAVVSRRIAALAEAGVLRRERGTIVIQDRARLKKIADDAPL